jgi:MYXO-CTERM domain-containing protein
MNTPNDDPKKPDNMELLKQQASACGPGCGCHGAAAPGKWRWVVGAIVLVAAGAMVARAVTKGDGPSAQAPETALAAAVAPKPATEKGDPAGKSAAISGEAGEGTSIVALADLNTAAADTDAVFIFLPGKGEASGNPPSTTMKGAARLIEAQGYKIGLFTLKTGGRDYDQIAAQMSVPGVLAIVKGAGMSPISGEITETKLVQGFVAATRAGGCGTGGCGPSGCK